MSMKRRLKTMTNDHKFNGKTMNNRPPKAVNNIPKMVVMNRKILVGSKSPKQITKK